jgi:hypothetical protein
MLRWVDTIDKNLITKNKEKPKICMNNMKYTEKHKTNKNYVTQTDTVDKNTAECALQVDTRYAEYLRHTQVDEYNHTRQDRDPTKATQGIQKKHK